MAERDPKFLARWSRRKSDARDDEPSDDAAPAPPAPADAGEGRQPTVAEPAPDEAEIVARLPDIDSLDETSDFTVFLNEGVPQAIRRRALRKLWRLNPLFANLDGLNDYDEDFTDAAMVIEGMKTAYKVGRGMLGDEPEPEAAPEASVEPPSEPDEQEQARADAPPDETASPPAEPPSPAPDEVPAGAAGAAGDGDRPAPRRPHPEPRQRQADRPQGTAARRRWGESAG